MAKGRERMFTSSAIHKLIPEGTRPMTADEIEERDRVNEANKGKKGFKKNTRKTVDTPFGAAGETYIKQKYYEVLFQRSAQTDTNAKATTWGHLVEQFAFHHLPADCILDSDKRYKHPKLWWTGAPDYTSDVRDVVGDIKCPYSMTGLINLLECFYSVDHFKKIKPEYYWQGVSNAVLTGKKFFELAVFCPQRSQLEAIRDHANNYDGDQNTVAWVNWATDRELPFLPTEGIVKNMNILKFEIPEADKKYLAKKVRLAMDEVKRLLDQDDRDIFKDEKAA